MVLDEPRATHIRWAFKTFALGQHTLRQLAEELTDRGFTMLATVRLPERPASIQMVHKILHNRYYLGRVTLSELLLPRPAERHQWLSAGLRRR